MNEFETDELNLVRQTRGATTEPNDESMTLGRARLERQIRDRAAEAAPGGRRASAAQFGRAKRAGRRTRGALWVGAGVVAVGALVGAVIVATPAPVLGPIAVEDSNAQAVELLERAADQVLVGKEDLQSGQYLKVVARDEGISSQWDTRTTDEGVPTALIRGVTHHTWYYSADAETLPIYRSSREFDNLILYPTGDSEAEQLLRESITKDLEIVANDPEAPDFFEQEVNLNEIGANGEKGTPPSDPSELRSFILSDELESPSEIPVQSDKKRVLSTAVAYVTNFSMPREVRAAAFRLIAEESNMSATSFNGHDAPALNRSDASSISISPGTSISFEIQLAGIVEEATTYSEELIFDEQSAQLLGTRMILAAPSKEFPGMPVGTVVGATSFTTSIVDEIPEVETWK